MLASQEIEAPYGYRRGWDHHQDISFYHQDVLGSVVMLTDKYGHVAERYQYDIWGNVYDGRFKDGFSGWGNARNDNVYGFTGQRYQAELGVYSFLYRDYSSRTMRWMTEDPIKDGLNWYQYCGSDPINYYDLLGLTVQPDPYATPEQKEAYEDAMNAITRTERGKELVDNLQNSDMQVTVRFNDSEQDHYNPDNNNVDWDLSVGLNTNEGVQTPALALAHELGHAEQDMNNEMNYSNQEEYNQIENNNVQNAETPIAQELGLPTRSDYNDYNHKNPLVETAGVNSNTPKELQEEMENWVDPPMTKYGLPGFGLNSEEEGSKN